VQWGNDLFALAHLSIARSKCNITIFWFSHLSTHIPVSCLNRKNGKKMDYVQNITRLSPRR